MFFYLRYSFLNFELQLNWRLAIFKFWWVCSEEVEKSFPASLLQIGGPFVVFYPRLNTSMEAVRGLSSGEKVPDLNQIWYKRRGLVHMRQPLPHSPSLHWPNSTTDVKSKKKFNWFLKKNEVYLITMQS